MVIGGGSEGPSRQSCCFSLKSLRLARHKRSNSSSLKEGCGRNYSSSSYFSDSNFHDCHAVFFSSRLAATRLDTTTTNTNWRPLWPVAVASITSSLGTARKSCRPQPPTTRSSGKKTTSLWWPTRRSRLCRPRRRPHRCLCSRDRRGKREELESYRCYLCLLEATASGRRQQNKQPPKRSLPPPPAPAKAATRSLSDDDNSSLRSWLEGLQQPLPFAA